MGFELSEFDIVFKAKVAVKGQALANFMAKFTPLPKMETENLEFVCQWLIGRNRIRDNHYVS